MNDSIIIDLFFARDEEAIVSCERKYGAYLLRVARNVLTDRSDSEECVNDTYMAAWTSIPPEKPSILSAYLSRITRNLSIDRLRHRTRQKRRPSEYALSLDELSECVPDNSTVDEEIELSLLTEAIEGYLTSLPQRNRALFVSRYFYCDSLRDAARYCGLSEPAAKSQLHRLRQGLREYLAKEGFTV